MLPAAALALILLAAPRLNGVAVTPFSENPSAGVTFLGMIDEIAATGATDVSIVVQWSQANVASNQILPHPKETQDEGVIRAMMGRARAKGLHVLLFPILWVEQRSPGVWRGTLRPENPGLWWASYRQFILHFADLAASERADLFSVGSELGTMEPDAAHWRALIAEVRTHFQGRLVYSANWDHFEAVPFWDAVDVVGLTAYHRLTEVQPPAQPAEEDLRAAWSRIRTVLLDWRQNHVPGRPFIFTEVGYPSMDGAAYRPWEYNIGGTVDLEEQRRCYTAFADVWQDEPALSGVYFWNWWGQGGAGDANYTPRGKPALPVMRRFFEHRQQGAAHRP